MFLEYAGYSHMFSNSICEMCGQVAEGCQTAALEQACLPMGTDDLREQGNQHLSLLCCLGNPQVLS